MYSVLNIKVNQVDTNLLAGETERNELAINCKKKQKKSYHFFGADFKNYRFGLYEN